MIRSVCILILWSCLCWVPMASAADFPFPSSPKSVQPVKPAKKLKQQVKKAPKIEVSRKSRPKTVAENPQVVVAPKRPAASSLKANDTDLQWVLGPLVANADGGKREGSASAEANLIVVEPGLVSSSNMIIELSGHVVKTAQTTARIDVRIGDIRRTVSWKSDDVESGRFNIEFKAIMTGSKIPDYLPVSAIAFVTNNSDRGAAMVSLTKIVVRFSNASLAQSQ
jgi:hypothetical protein